MTATYLSIDDYRRAEDVPGHRHRPALLGGVSLTSLIWWSSTKGLASGATQVPALACDGVPFRWPDFDYAHGAASVHEAVQFGLLWHASEWLDQVYEAGTCLVDE